jgi:hypothetical protein
MGDGVGNGELELFALLQSRFSPHLMSPCALSTPTAGDPLKFKAKRMYRRAPGNNDVLFDLIYSGVCHTDLHSAANHWGKLAPQVEKRWIPTQQCVCVCARARVFVCVWYDAGSECGQLLREREMGLCE